jgi:hypothetical protein
MTAGDVSKHVRGTHHDDELARRSNCSGNIYIGVLGRKYEGAGRVHQTSPWGWLGH